MSTPIIFLIEAIKTKRALNPYLCESMNHPLSLHWWETFQPPNSRCLWPSEHCLSKPLWSGWKKYIFFRLIGLLSFYLIYGKPETDIKLFKGLPWNKNKKYERHTIVFLSFSCSIIEPFNFMRWLTSEGIKKDVFRSGE